MSAMKTALILIEELDQAIAVGDHHKAGDRYNELVRLAGSHDTAADLIYAAHHPED